jgi:ABC-2 type transport system permease protein
MTDELARGPAEAAAGLPTGGSTARRIAAMILRYWYLLRGSWPRMFELAYWPTVQMIVWGMITVHLQGDSSWVSRAAGVLIAAVLLWDVFFRGQLGVSISFLEEVWSRNMGQLFVSPLRPVEWVLAMMAMSLIRTLIGIVPAALLAIALFDYSVFGLGLPLLAFFANLLIAGWSLAMVVIGFVLRYGVGAETLAWALVFLVLPIGAVYYPVDALPTEAQWLALALPVAHVFEGMRAILFGEGFAVDHLLWAIGLNGVCLTLSGLFFVASFEHARRHGSLLQQSE